MNNAKARRIAPKIHLFMIMVPVPFARRPITPLLSRPGGTRQ